MEEEVIDFSKCYLEHFCQVCGKPYTYPEGCNPQTCMNAPAVITVREWKDIQERIWRLEQRTK